MAADFDGRAMVVVAVECDSIAVVINSVLLLSVRDMQLTR